jgi:hypothetical protein
MACDYWRAWYVIYDEWPLIYDYMMFDARAPAPPLHADMLYGIWYTAPGGILYRGIWYMNHISYITYHISSLEYTDPDYACGAQNRPDYISMFSCCACCLFTYYCILFWPPFHWSYFNQWMGAVILFWCTHTQRLCTHAPRVSCVIKLAAWVDNAKNAPRAPPSPFVTFLI